jgi:hypothetical protein
MCFPHKVWLREWQLYHNKTHNNIKCKEKYHIDRITSPVTYVYDDNTSHRCFVCKTARPDALTVKNWNAYHVCVDGGLIRFGCRNYMFNFQYPQGRCDSMVFDNRDLWFVEFKMNTTTILDDQLWNDLKDGMQQIREFIHNLRSKMAHKRTPLHKYFRLSHQHCTVCMRCYPRMNTKRNTYLEEFRIETGIKLQQLVVIP